MNLDEFPLLLFQYPSVVRARSVELRLDVLLVRCASLCTSEAPKQRQGRTLDAVLVYKASFLCRAMYLRQVLVPESKGYRFLELLIPRGLEYRIPEFH